MLFWKQPEQVNNLKDLGLENWKLYDHFFDELFGVTSLLIGCVYLLWLAQHRKFKQDKHQSAMTTEEALHKFGFLLGAFEYGAPPHGGLAFGFDRLCSILGGSESIRDFIAFPKNNAGRDVMLDAPSTIDDKQFVELQIKLNLTDKA
jgi:hypothetical protein